MAMSKTTRSFVFQLIGGLYAVSYGLTTGEERMICLILSSPMFDQTHALIALGDGAMGLGSEMPASKDRAEAQ